MPDIEPTPPQPTTEPTAAESPPPRQPWSFKWIILAILIYMLLFNLYLWIMN